MRVLPCSWRAGNRAGVLQVLPGGMILHMEARNRVKGGALNN